VSAVPEVPENYSRQPRPFLHWLIRDGVAAGPLGFVLTQYSRSRRCQKILSRVELGYVIQLR
jgi:hypothetical protein